MRFRGNNIYNASFNVFANNYHAVRPGYPKELFDDIRSVCEVNNNSRMLEIGAGSGIATVELAKMGSRIVAVEPGSKLAEITRKQTSDYDNVKVFEGTFESYLSDDSFDVVLAFTAFHWLNEGDKFQQVIDLLQSSGYLVLVWNSFFQGDSEVVREVNAVYRDMLSGVYSQKSEIKEVNEGVLSKLNRREEEVLSHDLFYPIFLKKYLTVYNYDKKSYPMLLNTYPKIVAMADKKRKIFLNKIGVIVEKFGKISVPVLSTLIICHRRDYLLEMISKSKGDEKNDKSDQY